MLTLVKAQVIVSAALAEGRRLGLAPLTVAVLDAGGHLVAFAREDGSGIARYDIAFGKAWGSLGLGFGSRELTSRATSNPGFFQSYIAATGGRAVASPGGVLIADADGRVVGAVGISGDLGDRDEACAVAGVDAAGYEAVPAMPS